VGGAAACNRLRSTSAGVAAGVAVEGDVVPWELPWRDVSGWALLRPPVGVRSPSLMASSVWGVVQGNDGGVGAMLLDGGGVSNCAGSMSTCTSHRRSAAVR
jgi:hypothetical protein